MAKVVLGGVRKMHVGIPSCKTAGRSVGILVYETLDWINQSDGMPLRMCGIAIISA